MKKNIVIIILIAIIVVIFITFGVLFWNGTISFNKEVNNDGTQQYLIVKVKKEVKF